jgi:hypothetical protein
MLYAYCICEEDNQDNFLENSFIGGHFGAEVSETASWERTFEQYEPDPLYLYFWTFCNKAFNQHDKHSWLLANDCERRSRAKKIRAWNL